MAFPMPTSSGALPICWLNVLDIESAYQFLTISCINDQFRQALGRCAV